MQKSSASARARASLVLASCLAVSSACGSSRSLERASTTPDTSQNAPAPSAAWDTFVNELIEASFVRDPGSAAWQGRHEFDGQVQDLSEQAVAGRIEAMKAERERARSFSEATLTPAQRFERDYVIAVLEGELFWAERMQNHRRSPLYYSGAVDPSLYLTRNYAPEDVRLRAYIAHLSHVPRVVSQMKQNLSLPMPKSFVEVGIKVWGGLGPYLEKDAPEIFASVKDETLQAQLTAHTKAAVLAANEAKAWLEGQLASATSDYALGEERFRELLWATERVDTPLDVLTDMGKRDLERNLADLSAACTKLVPGKPTSDCISHVNEDKPKEGPVLAARRQLTGLREFLVKQPLVSIPSDEIADVQEAPPYKRWNQAYIEIPGPYETGMPSVYYIAPPDPTWSEEDQRAYIPGDADLLFISVHEVWPGHFLQYLHAKKSERMFGRLFVGYAFAEGWAHYTEELMWEAGMSEADPKVRVGQLLNALLRNVRFLSAIGLHTGGMTVEESEKMFRERAFQDPGNARQQAARGTFDPGYLNYTLGKLMIRKMREDYCATRGGKECWRGFHDALLSFGGPPLPLVRKALVGESGTLL